ncbi:MAG: RnfABCDGE type electron transport complex subunit D, partial [Thermoplasmatales archaeon]
MKEENNIKKTLVSPGPHLSSKKAISKTMYLVIIALLLPTIGSIYFFGVYVIAVILVSIITAILTEYVAKKLRKKEFYMDGSAILTGLLLALILPPRIPLWAVVIGAAVSIAIAKEAFGGLGHNVFNPALVGRAFLTTSFTGLMTRYVLPVETLTGDAITTATPLSESFVQNVDQTTLYQNLFVGNVAGSIGETSALLILIGGLFLIALKIINWRIPLIYIGSVF